MSIAGFRVTGVLGRGGMGVVYRAEAPDGTPVALKVLQSSLADPATVRRFELEARIPIVHPNVVRVVSAGADAGMPYLALELLEGESLAERLARGPMSAAEAIDVGRQVCAGLAAAHALGIVHRDLKPSNLFVCRDGRVKLLDFGIALWTDEETRLTRTGSLIGTPSYLAPELVHGHGRVDGRADLWSLGVILYQALTGQRPFARESPMATLLAAIVDPHVPLLDLAPELPVELAEVVERCLEKDRHQRWPTAEALADALASVDPTHTAAHDGTAARASGRESIPSGERRIVVLLLADDVRDVGAVRLAIERRGGSFVAVRRNTVLGLFGSPTWTGHEPVAACDAALEARAHVGAVAIATGRASQLAGAFAGDVVRAVETACRAALVGVALDRETATAVANRIATRQVRDELFEIVADAPPRAPEQELPIVGRRVELGQIETAVRALLEDRRAMAVLVTGPAGIGKSRLRVAFEHMLADAAVERAEAVPILFARAEPHRSEDALHVAGALLLHHAETSSIGEPEGPHDVVLRLARDAYTDEDDARAAADALANLPGLETRRRDPTPTLRDPQTRESRIRLAVHDWLVARLLRGPLAIVIEQIQWADEDSLALVADILENEPDLPLIVFATARPELATEPFGNAPVLSITPRPLGASDVAALAQAIAGRPFAEPIVRAVHARTGGNPLFVEQIVRELVEIGRLETHDAAGDASASVDVAADAAPTEELPLPLSVEAAVQTRLDQLPSIEREACMLASVFGRTFTLDGLIALGLRDPGPVVAALEQRGLVAPARRGASRELVFRSSLVADVALRSLTDERLTKLHARAAVFLSANRDAPPADVARHWELAGNAGAAARAYADAALLAERRGDGRSALRWSDRALSLGAPSEVRWAIAVARASAFGFLGRRTEQARELDDAEARAPSDADRARVLIEQSAALSATGESTRGIERADAALEAARKAGDPHAVVVALVRRAAGLIYVGRLDEAATTLDEAFARRDEVPAGTRALLASWRGQLATARGDLSARRAAYVEAVAEYRAAGDLRRAAGVESNLADTLNRFGACMEAEQQIRAALDSCRRVGNRRMEGYALANLGYALTGRGRIADAIETLSSAESLAKAMRDPRLVVAVRTYGCRARLARGDDPAMIAIHAREAAEEASRVGLPALEVAALTLAASASERAGDPAAAQELSERALARRDELGSIEEDEAEVFLVRARCLQAVGRHAEADVVLRRARERVTELANRIGDPDWRRRFLEDVPAHRQLMGENHSVSA
ncbi:MAG: protein kinase [Deltaproteobacteria bacterium]|nr:protein kinase [Deltaproteobacteria bacterium]